MKLLKVASVGIALAVGVALPAFAQEQWKLGSAKPPSDIGAVLDDQVLAAMNTASGGALAAERQAVTNEQEMVQQVIRGRLQMGVTSAFGIGAAITDAPVLSLPYLWNSDEERMFVTQNYVRPVLTELFAEKGLVLLTFGESGYNGIFCKEKCSLPDDFKGVKVRISPNPVSKAFWEAVGAIGVQLPVGDTWPALEQNLVSGGDLPFAYYSSTPGVTSAPVFVNSKHLHHPWIYFANKASWETLPADTREKIMAGFPATEDLSAQYFADGEGKVKAAVEKGVKFLEPTAEETAAWRGKIEPILPDLVAGMTPGALKLFAAINEGKAEFKKRKGN